MGQLFVLARGREVETETDKKKKEEEEEEEEKSHCYSWRDSNLNPRAYCTSCLNLLPHYVICERH